MELTDLKVFMAILEEGSLSRAAQRLDYVQSNITMRIRKLESELGVQLFHRHPKGVTPTEKGLVFGKYASDILLLTDEAVTAVREPDYPCGPLAIGVVETLASTGPFMHALSQFQSSHPEVSLSLITGTSPENYAKVLDRQLDGAFFTGDFVLSSLHVAIEIHDEVVLLTSASQKSPADVPNMADAAWILFPKGCPFRASSEDWLQSEGIPPANVIEISTLETMLNCVRAGLGYALLPKSAVTRNDIRLRTYPVPEKYRFATTRLVCRKEQFPSKAFAAFTEYLKAAGI